MKSPRLTNAFLSVSLVATWSITTTALGAEAAESTEQPASQATLPAPQESAGSAFSLQLNLDFTNSYFFRGIREQDEGVIIQPAARLTANLYTEGDFKLDAFLATWNSFGENGGTQTSDLTRYWFESDLLGGFVLTRGKLSVTTSYVFYTSPSDAYQTVQELDFTVAYDDSDLLGKFALHPYFLYALETGADGTDGADTDPGSYLEFGIAPGFSFDVGKTTVALSFPVSVGLSLRDYYQDAAGEDDTFGFVQVGAKAAIPLPFADRWGKWTLNAGVSELFLGDNTAGYNGGDDTEFIAMIGLQLNL